MIKIIFRISSYWLIHKFQSFIKRCQNNSSFKIKFSKTQLSNIVQSGGYLGSLFGPLLKTRLPLIGNIFNLSAKSVLIPLGLTEAAWTTDAAIRKKMFGSGFATLIIFNEEMNGIMKIVKSLEESRLIAASSVYSPYLFWILSIT